MKTIGHTILGFIEFFFLTSSIFSEGGLGHYYTKIENMKKEATLGQFINHVAIIPDGNRRWAKAHHLSIKDGHRKGLENLVELTHYMFSSDINTVTLWLFSTENWKRDKQEVSDLMEIYKNLLKKFIELAHVHKARITHLGRKDRLPTDLMEEIKLAEQTTKHYNVHVLFLALDYGGRDELVRAIKQIILDGIDADEITEELVSDYLDTNTTNYPNPDIVIRLGARVRLSGFLPWQSTYSELMFLETYCPDFDIESLKKCFEDYKNRERTLGQ